METIDHTALLIETLTNIFGYEDFKSEDQERATTEVFAGKNDVYINLRPGAGKSICFQLPAALKDKSLTIVFVPTKSLAKNQVDFLKQKNISAEYLCTSTWKKPCENVYKTLKSDVMKLQILYASTDKKTKTFIEDLIATSDVQSTVPFVVFDEAQCICPLSHDYSASYRDLARSFKGLFPKVRKIALTGSATIEVKDDIIHELGMINPVTFHTSRQWTMYHDVCFIDILLEPFSNLKDFINDNIGPLVEKTSKNPEKCGIIYCRKKVAVKKIEKELKELEIPVVSYHGDMSLEDRTSVHDRWIDGKIAVLVTTKNFPSGIHGPNVRFVVHWSMPTSVQQFYQDIGRCVQDGRKSSSRIYFSMEEESDISKHIQSLSDTPHGDDDIAAKKHAIFADFIDYCLQTKCRLVAQMACFGSTVASCKRYCDVCRDFYGLKQRVAQFLQLQHLVNETIMLNLARKRTQHSQSAYKSIENDKSARRNEIKVYGISSKYRERFYNRLFRHLLYNYHKAKRKAEKTNDIKDDLSEIARRLEYSVFLGANCPQKYHHDIDETIRVIQKFNACNSICAYIKHYWKTETSLPHEKPELIDLTDDDNKFEQTAKNRIAIGKDDTMIETVDLIDDSDTGSETP